jgi:hypothetical protein
MPCLSGAEMVARIRDRLPDIPILHLYDLSRPRYRPLPEGGRACLPNGPGCSSGTRRPSSGPLPGYVWLDTPGKVLHVEAARLEFRSDPPSVNAHS